MNSTEKSLFRRLGFIPFPEELVLVKREFMAFARQRGLDPGEVIFDFLKPEEIAEVAAYDGFPSRYPHWRFGMAFDQQEKSQQWGLMKIYEMVINNRPAFAYLLQGTEPVVQRMVIAHVLGHCDFFSKNCWFEKTNRNMLNEMANHSSRIRRHTSRWGVEKVESFLDTCLSLENLTDPAYLFLRPSSTAPETGGEPEGEEPRRERESGLKFSSTYLDTYYKQGLDREKGREEPPAEAVPALGAFPKKPTKGVLDFLVDNAPLKDWERDLLDIVRDEAYYFLPQRLTKIMNEGWAVYWHSRIMVARGLTPADAVQYADENSKILAAQSGRLNPYRLGYYLFEDITDRWNKGRHGAEWEACKDMRRREKWDTGEGKGAEKVLEVRAAYNDAQFIDEFLTPEFALKQNLFTYKMHPREKVYAIESKDFEKVKSSLLQHISNGGEPTIELQDANYKNRSELFLRHRHAGIDLKFDEAKRTLHALFGVWRRPVNIETLSGGKKKVLRFDGHRDSEEQG